MCVCVCVCASASMFQVRISTWSSSLNRSELSAHLRVAESADVRGPTGLPLAWQSNMHEVQSARTFLRAILKGKGILAQCRCTTQTTPLTQTLTLQSLPRAADVFLSAIARAEPLWFHRYPGRSPHSLGEGEGEGADIQNSVHRTGTADLDVAAAETLIPRADSVGTIAPRENICSGQPVAVMDQPSAPAQPEQYVATLAAAAEAAATQATDPSGPSAGATILCVQFVSVSRADLQLPSVLICNTPSGPLMIDGSLRGQLHATPAESRVTAGRARARSPAAAGPGPRPKKPRLSQRPPRTRPMPFSLHTPSVPMSPAAAAASDSARALPLVQIKSESDTSRLSGSGPGSESESESDHSGRENPIAAIGNGRLVQEESGRIRTPTVTLSQSGVQLGVLRPPTRSDIYRPSISRSHYPMNQIDGRMVEIIPHLDWGGPSGPSPFINEEPHSRRSGTVDRIPDAPTRRVRGQGGGRGRTVTAGGITGSGPPPAAAQSRSLFWCEICRVRSTSQLEHYNTAAHQRKLDDYLRMRDTLREEMQVQEEEEEEGAPFQSQHSQQDCDSNSWEYKCPRMERIIARYHQTGRIQLESESEAAHESDGLHESDADDHEPHAELLQNNIAAAQGAPTGTATAVTVKTEGQDESDPRRPWQQQHSQQQQQQHSMRDDQTLTRSIRLSDTLTRMPIPQGSTQVPSQSNQALRAHAHTQAYASSSSSSYIPSRKRRKSDH